MMMFWITIICVALTATEGSRHHRGHRLRQREDSCDAVMERAGLTTRFPGVVGHSIHSLSVEDLRSFEPDVTEDNKIPTVNLDLRADLAILPNAPNLQVNSPFKTFGMRIVDRVLSNMDQKSYDIKHYTPLERLVHALHMQEVWSEAVPHYQKFKREPPVDEALCRCVRDMENNGIMKTLRFVALQIREPGLMYASKGPINGTIPGYKGPVYTVYNYAFFPMSDKDLQFPIKEDKVIPRLRNEAAWRHWKKMMMEMKPSDAHDLALFLYCSLNEPQMGLSDTE